MNPSPTFKYHPSLTCGTSDAKKKRSSRGKPRIGRATEDFERKLVKVGGHIGHIIDGYAPKPGDSTTQLTRVLTDYSNALKPWARQVSTTMIEEVNARDLEGWRVLAKQMSQQLGRDIAGGAISFTMAKLAAEQTELISSLPIDAAERVQRLTVEGLISGSRYAELQREIERSGEVSKAQARVIARTETSRTASNLTQARALLSGCPNYRWRTVRDGTVREGHRAMEGKICEWANPPEVDEGGRLMHFHPGCIWNCRCWAEIIIED